MARKFLTPIDLAKNSLLNAVIQPLAAAPSSPSAGQVYFDTTLGEFGYYTGTQWVYPGAGTGVLTDILKGNGSGGFASAVAGTDYLAPTGNGSALTGLTQSQIAGLTAALALLAPLASPALTGTPTAPTPAGSDNSTTLATTAFVQGLVSALAQGLQVKPTARLATAAALPSNTYANGTAGVGATLTATANGALSIDSAAVAVNDVVLAKNEATAANNGLYVVTQAGDGSHPYILTRHADMDQAAEFSGAFIPVGNAGSSNANSLWLANPSGAVTVGTTAIPFTQLNGATDLVAGAGVAISGNTVSIENSGVLTTAHGGTGGATVAAAKASLGFGSVYNSGAIGDGTSTTLTVTHNLNNTIPLVQVYDVSGSNPVQVICDVTATSANAVQLGFGTAPASNSIQCVVVG